MKILKIYTSFISFMHFFKDQGMFLTLLLNKKAIKFIINNF